MKRPKTEYCQDRCYVAMAEILLARCRKNNAMSLADSRKRSDGYASTAIGAKPKPHTHFLGGFGFWCRRAPQTSG